MYRLGRCARRPAFVAPAATVASAAAPSSSSAQRTAQHPVPRPPAPRPARGKGPNRPPSKLTPTPTDGNAKGLDKSKLQAAERTKESETHDLALRTVQDFARLRTVRTSADADAFVAYRKRCENFKRTGRFYFLQGSRAEQGPSLLARSIQVPRSLQVRLEEFQGHARTALRAIHKQMVVPQQRHAGQGAVLDAASDLTRHFYDIVNQARHLGPSLNGDRKTPVPLPTLVYEELLEAYTCASAVGRPSAVYPRLSYDSDNPARLNWSTLQTMRKHITRRRLPPRQAERLFAGGIESMSQDMQRPREPGTIWGMIEVLSLFYRMLQTHVTMEASTLCLFIEAFSHYGLYDSGEQEPLGAQLAPGMNLEIPFSHGGLGKTDSSTLRGAVQAYSIFKAAVHLDQAPLSPGTYNTLIQALLQARELGLASDVLLIMQEQPDPVPLELGSLMGALRGWPAQLTCISSSANLPYFRVDELTVSDITQPLPLATAALLLYRPLTSTFDRAPEGYTWVRYLPGQSEDPAQRIFRHKMFTVLVQSKKTTWPRQVTLTGILSDYIKASLLVGDLEAAHKAIAPILRTIVPPLCKTPSRDLALLTPELIDVYVRGLLFNGQRAEALRWLEAAVQYPLDPIHDARADEDPEYELPVHVSADLVQYVADVVRTFYHYYPGEYRAEEGEQLERIVLAHATEVGWTIPTPIVSALFEHRLLSPSPSGHDAVLQLLLRLDTIEHAPLEPGTLAAILPLVTRSLAAPEQAVLAPQVFHRLATYACDVPPAMRGQVGDGLHDLEPSLVRSVLATQGTQTQEAWSRLLAGFKRLSESGAFSAPGPGCTGRVGGKLMQMFSRLYSAVRAQSKLSPMDLFAGTSDASLARLWGWALAGAGEEAHSLLEEYTLLETERLGCAESKPVPLLLDTSGPVDLLARADKLPDLGRYIVQVPGSPAVPLCTSFPRPLGTSERLRLPETAAQDTLLALDEAVRRRSAPSGEQVCALLENVGQVHEHRERWLAYLYQLGLSLLLRPVASPPGEAQDKKLQFFRLERAMVRALLQADRVDLALLHWARLEAQDEGDRDLVPNELYRELLVAVPQEHVWVPVVEELLSGWSRRHGVTGPVREAYLSWFGDGEQLDREGVQSEEWEATMRAAVWQGDVHSALGIYRAWPAATIQGPRNELAMHSLAVRACYRSYPDQARRAINAVLESGIEMDAPFKKLVLRSGLVDDELLARLDLGRDLKERTYAADLVRWYGTRSQLDKARELYRSIRQEYGGHSWAEVEAMMAALALVDQDAMLDTFRQAISHGTVPPDSTACGEVITLLSNAGEEGLRMARWVFDAMRPLASLQEQEAEMLQDGMLAFETGVVRSCAAHAWPARIRRTAATYRAMGLAELRGGSAERAMELARTAEYDASCVAGPVEAAQAWQSQLAMHELCTAVGSQGGACSELQPPELGPDGMPSSFGPFTVEKVVERLGRVILPERKPRE